MWNGLISCKGYHNVSLTAVRLHKSLQCIFIIFTQIISYMLPASQHLSMSKDKIVVLYIFWRGLKFLQWMCLSSETDNSEVLWSAFKTFKSVCDQTIKWSPDMLATSTGIVNI